MGKKNKVDPGTEQTELETERALLDKKKKLKLPKDEPKDLKLKGSPAATDRGDNIETDRGLETDRPLVQQDSLAPKASEAPKNSRMSMVSFRNSYRNFFTLKQNSI